MGGAVALEKWSQQEEPGTIGGGRGQHSSSMVERSFGSFSVLFSLNCFIFTSSLMREEQKLRFRRNKLKDFFSCAPNL
jgi:hypothetical protein